MATGVIMPALGMAQEVGTLVHWLKHDGETVAKGEPIMEIETDKVTVEIEASASGILSGVIAKEGEVVPVGRTIAWILAPGETPPSSETSSSPITGQAIDPVRNEGGNHPATPQKTSLPGVSPLARRIAEEHGIDLESVKHSGKRIEKDDVLDYIREPGLPEARTETFQAGKKAGSHLAPASPKARRLASERGIELATLAGSGPDGAVQAEDVLAVTEIGDSTSQVETPGTVWRLMAERMTESWTTVPHFYLVREVDASNLVEWRQHSLPAVENRTGIKLTYTDLIVKLLGTALQDHPRLNAAWAVSGAGGGIQLNQEINVGIAAAVEDGLIVPVIQHADRASLSEIAAKRHDLIERAQKRKLRPEDISGGTITLTNLGMYNVDAFHAIINTPQAAILAVGRIADRVVPVNGQPAVRPMMVLTVSCDHRVVDGARAAQFMDDLANLIEDPWRLLV